VAVNIDGNKNTVTNAQLVYKSSTMDEPDTVALHGGVRLTATIPAQEDGTFVWYSAIVTDTSGTDFTTPSPGTTRVLFNGIDEIADIQETWEEFGGASPFEGQILPMYLTVTVQSDPATSGLVVVQDGETLDPYTGILLSIPREMRPACRGAM